ncbi:LppX_LprAFG lipoprotein [Streptomyces sp. NPDC051211]|uniref:LppX_LprAFG lipoprotein n=1 Tax=Streptomyces sp. NPDC051211 TaxID=3154643 RepID=UPI00344CE657
MIVHRKKTRTAGAVLAAVLLAGGATACGETKAGGKADGGGNGGTGVTEVAPAAYLEKVKKKSEEFTSVRYTMSGSAAGQAVSGEVSMRLKPTVGMAMKMAHPQKPGESVEIRLLDGVMYMGAESKWLKFDLKSADPNAAKQLEALSSAGSSAENPGDRAGELQTAKDLKKVGEETIDGQKTTHLSGTVSIDEVKAAMATATPEAKARQEKSLKQLEAQGIKSLTVDMWIDGNDRTKQVRTRGEGTQGPLDMTMKFTDYNQPVEITAPPADQVVDLAELSKRAADARS